MGKQQLRPQPSSWVIVCASLSPPATPVPPTLGCQTPLSLSTQPTSGNKARQPGIILFAPLADSSEAGLQGYQSSRKGRWLEDLSVHRITPPDPSRELPTGATIIPPARIPSPGFVPVLYFATLLSPLAEPHPRRYAMKMEAGWAGIFGWFTPYYFYLLNEVKQRGILQDKDRAVGLFPWRKELCKSEKEK